MKPSEVAYQSLGPMSEDDQLTEGEHLRLLVDAVLAPVDRIHSIAGSGEDDEPGWSMPFDLERAPLGVLPWTAQFVGSTIVPAMSDSDARSAIRTPDGFSRGLERAMRAAGERTLTGSRRLIIYPRIPDPFTVYIRSLHIETPDPGATEAALRAQTPWWLNLDYAAVTGLSYVDVASRWESYDAVEAEGVTYGDIEVMPP